MKRKQSKGFTLVELLVVVAITALMSALAIVYSHVGQNEVSIGIEAAKISQLILQAKQLSISTYNANSVTCAYGVHFDYASSTYSLFAYNSATSTSPGGPLFCPTYANTIANGVITADMAQYLGGATWQVKLAQGVVFHAPTGATDVLTDVLFFPPTPLIIMSRNGTTFASSTPTSRIYLQTVDGKNSRFISLSPAGQVGY